MNFYYRCKDTISGKHYCWCRNGGTKAQHLSVLSDTNEHYRRNGGTYCDFVDVPLSCVKRLFGITKWSGGKEWPER